MSRYFDSNQAPPETELSPALVAYYRQIIDTHRTNTEHQVCNICGIARCPDWLDAYDKLAAAGELMADPEQWEGRLNHAVRRT